MCSWSQIFWMAQEIFYKYLIISQWRAALRKKLFWTFLLQISQLKNDQNFTLLRPPLQHFPQKNHKKNQKNYIFFLSKNLGSFASSKKGMNTFHYEMSKKWFFTFMNFQNVYWHGKAYSAMTATEHIFHCPTMIVADINWLDDNHIINPLHRHHSDPTTKTHCFRFHQILSYQHNYFRFAAL